MCAILKLFAIIFASIAIKKVHIMFIYIYVYVKAAKQSPTTLNACLNIHPGNNIYNDGGCKDYQMYLFRFLAVL